MDDISSVLGAGVRICRAHFLFVCAASSGNPCAVRFTLFSDKFLHAVEYAILGALCYRAIRGSGHGVWRQHAIPAAILLASLYGVSDEVHQAFVPFRDSTWLDWLADTVGAALGVTAMHRVLSLRPVGSIPEALP